MIAPYPVRLDLMKSLMWDYNIPAEECLEVLDGKRESAGHYNKTTLFIKILESYRWFTVLKLLPPEIILEQLTDQVLNSLRTKSLMSNYEYIRKELRRNLQVTG